MLETLPYSQIFISAIVILAAYITRGLCGFGSGLIAIPLLALILPLSIVIPMIVSLDYLASAGQGIKQHELIKTRELIYLLPFSILGIIAALYIFKSIDTDLLIKSLGIFIIIYALYTLANVAPNNFGYRILAIPAGLLGGFIGTLFGTGGPFYVIYLKLRGLQKSEFRATFSAIFLLDGFGRLTGYFFSDFFNIDTLILIISALPIMLIGMFIGGHLHTNMTQQTFQRAISILLIISGTALLIK